MKNSLSRRDNLIAFSHLSPLFSVTIKSLPFTFKLLTITLIFPGSTSTSCLILSSINTNLPLLASQLSTIPIICFNSCSLPASTATTLSNSPPVFFSTSTKFVFNTPPIQKTIIPKANNINNPHPNHFFLIINSF